jgi:hypothetical protein
MKFHLNPAAGQPKIVMQDLIRHPVFAWIPAFAGMTDQITKQKSFILDQTG